MNKALSFILFVALVFLVAFFGSQFQPDAWYENLAKPSWQPPGWVFAPVWTVLYILIALSGWLAWTAQAGKRTVPFLLYFAQLLFNALWSFLFFGLHLLLIPFLDLLILWITLLGTILAFWRLRPVSGALLIPYLLWVSYAGVLNFAIWRLNT